MVFFFLKDNNILEPQRNDTNKRHSIFSNKTLKKKNPNKRYKKLMEHYKKNTQTNPLRPKLNQNNKSTMGPQSHQTPKTKHTKIHVEVPYDKTPQDIRRMSGM